MYPVTELEMNRTIKRIAVVLVMALVMLACRPSDLFEPKPEPPTIGFNILSAHSSDSILVIRVSWTPASDDGGPAEYYVHTMTSSKLVTDSVTGPLPNEAIVNGTADTVSIKIASINDEVTLTANVWSVRRGLRSTAPAIGLLVIRRGDQPPPPPDSITVDTIVIGMIFGGPGMTYGLCCGPALAGPWLDTLRFNRLYSGTPPAQLIGATDVVSVVNGTTIVSSYRNPLVKFSLSAPGIIDLVENENTAIFRALTSNQTVYIRAEYSGRIDSLLVRTGTAGYCGSWPDCYYNPIVVQMPELPRVYVDIPPYVPLPSPAVQSTRTALR